MAAVVFALFALISSSFGFELSSKQHVDLELRKTRTFLRNTVRNHVQLQGNVHVQAGFCDSAEVACEYTTCAACIAAGSDYKWIGYCNKISISEHTAPFGKDTLTWGGSSGNMDCSVQLTSRQWQDPECNSDRAGATTTCTSHDASVSITTYYGVTISRIEIKATGEMTLIDHATGLLSLQGFLNSIEVEMLGFIIHGGYLKYTNGPPVMYQGNIYFFIPKGGFTGNGRVRGSQSFVVFDSVFQYQLSAHSSGVGRLAAYSGVEFETLQGTLNLLRSTGAGLNQSQVVEVCTTSGTTVCLRARMSSGGFRWEGLNISNTAMKTDVLVKGAAYLSPYDSLGFRMLTVSTSYSGTVSVDETGNDANEFEDTFGAAYLKVEKTVYTSATTLLNPSQNQETHPVLKNEQTYSTDAGTECGWTVNDWPGQQQTDDDTSETFTSAHAFFQARSFPLMKCAFYSFASGNASHNHFLWDPVMGMDTAAARSSATGSSDSSSSGGTSTGLIVGVAVGGAAAVVLSFAIVWWYIRRKKAAEEMQQNTSNLAL